MAVKRRVIWLDDADWLLLAEQAKRRGQNPSALIREMTKEAWLRRSMQQEATR